MTALIKATSSRTIATVKLTYCYLLKPVVTSSSVVWLIELVAVSCLSFMWELLCRF